MVSAAVTDRNGMGVVTPTRGGRAGERKAQCEAPLTKLTSLLTGLQVEVHWEGTDVGDATLTCRLSKPCLIEGAETAGTRRARRGWSGTALTHTASRDSEMERVEMRMVKWKRDVRAGTGAHKVSATATDES